VQWVGNVSREEAISLLVELASVCRAYLQAPLVYLAKDNSGKWGLNIKYIAKDQEKECIVTVAAKHDYNTVEIDGFTVF
jgi:hypothetical protein